VLLPMQNELLASFPPSAKSGRMPAVISLIVILISTALFAGW